MGARTDFFSHTDNLFYSSSFCHFCYPAVESAWWFATLEYITQYESAFLGLGVGTATHEVEGDVKRMDIRVICVIDECTTIHSVFYLQTHRNRFQSRHPLTDGFKVDLVA